MHLMFKNYEYFLAIADCGSLSKAADKLYISQPSLSKYLSRLENSMDIDLFDHTGSPLRLTYAGELYYSYIGKVMELERQLERDFAEIRNNGRDKICVGIGPWRGTCVLPTVLPLFERRYPNIEVKVVEGLSDFLENAVVKNNVDFCIMSLPVNYEKSTYEVFMDEKILLVGNNEHPLVKEARTLYPGHIGYPHMDLLRLKHETFFLTTSGQNFAHVVQSLFSKLDFQPDHIREIQNLTTALNLVVRGMGFCFLPEAGLKMIPCHSNISFFTVGEPYLEWQLAAVYKRTSRLSKSARLFIDTLKELY